MIRAIVACERSGVVREALRRRGVDAVSCDIEPAEDGSPHHHRGDALELIDRRQFDLMICHPECRYVSASGTHWVKRQAGRLELLEEGIAFALALWNSRVPSIALENPIGVLSRALRPPDQIVQPYQFGHDASKATCLWLCGGLTPLRPDPALFVRPRLVCSKCGQVLRGAVALGGEPCLACAGGRLRPRWGNQTDSGQNRLSPSAGRSYERARTYEGIAEAMAETWVRDCKRKRLAYNGDTNQGDRHDQPDAIC